MISISYIWNFQIRKKCGHPYSDSADVNLLHSFEHWGALRRKLLSVILSTSDRRLVSRDEHVLDHAMKILRRLARLFADFSLDVLSDFIMLRYPESGNQCSSR